VSAAVIDTATFRGLQEAAGAEFVAELVDTFLEEAPAMLRELQAALATGDADKFRRAAHSLKSNSQAFGASALGERAKQLELGGMARASAASLDALSHEYARAAAALMALRDA
jgi:histidine phosphotransfer protein HptB